MQETEEKKKEKVTENEGQAKEKKGKPKGCLILLAILLLIIGGLIAGWKYLTASQQNTVLTVDSGQVEVNAKAGKTGQALSVGDSVKTSSASQATISFPGGTETRLDENTQIKINSAGENISIFQSLGRTWSRVINLLGVVNYQVESENMIASVRGTAFSEEVTDQGTNVDVEDSQVQTSIGSSTLLIEKGFRASVRKGQRQAIKQLIPEETKNSNWFTKNRERDQVLLEKIRKKSKSPIQILKTAREISPDDIAKLRGLAARFGTGGATITPAQADQISALDLSSPSGMARALAIIDPQEFSDTGHWTRVLTALFPFIERFGIEKIIQEQ